MSGVDRALFGTFLSASLLLLGGGTLAANESEGAQDQVQEQVQQQVQSRQPSDQAGEQVSERASERASEQAHASEQADAQINMQADEQAGEQASKQADEHVNMPTERALDPSPVDDRADSNGLQGGSSNSETHAAVAIEPRNKDQLMSKGSDLSPQPPAGSDEGSDATRATVARADAPAAAAGNQEKESQNAEPVTPGVTVMLPDLTMVPAEE